jgi:hypothetical protein
MEYKHIIPRKNGRPVVNREFLQEVKNLNPEHHERCEELVNSAMETMELRDYTDRLLALDCLRVGYYMQFFEIED